ncbi:hypothetical protein ACPV5Q_00025 [Vibrio astriarenae]
MNFDMYYIKNLDIIDVDSIIPAKDYVLSSAIKRLECWEKTEHGVEVCVELSDFYEDYANRVLEIVNSLPAMLFMVESEEGGAVVFNGLEALDSLRVNGLESTEDCPIEDNFVLEIFIDEVCSWYKDKSI